MKLKKVPIIKIGSSYGIIIPKPYIANGQIDLDKIYEVDFNVQAADSHQN